MNLQLEYGVRSQLLKGYDVGQFFYDQTGAAKKMRTVGLIVDYALTIPSRRKRTSMNVDKMVKTWVTVVTGLSIAHDKDGLDDYESQLDNLLLPLLSAPVKQLREFAPKLVAALKTNPQVPFFVWRGFEVWIDKTVMPAKDESIIQLKTDLAAEIARMVEPDIRGDLMHALVGALQWRSEERLQEIKTAVEAGGKATARPKVVGRQSCLFLSVKRGRGRKPVEVML